VGEIAINELKKKSKATEDAAFRKRLLKALQELEDDYVAGFGGAMKSVVDMGYNTSLMLPFDMPNQDAIDVLRARNANRRLALLEARGLESFDSIRESLTERIVNLVADGKAESLSVSEIADKIRDITKGTKAASRALTIARTESLTATSIGQAAAMKDAAKATGEKIFKMWITAQDDRVRGLDEDDDYSHADIHGQVRAYDKPFYDKRSGTKIMFPREPGQDAGMVINCRCDWVMVPESNKDIMDEWKSELESNEV